MNSRNNRFGRIVARRRLARLNAERAERAMDGLRSLFSGFAVPVAVGDSPEEALLSLCSDEVVVDGKPHRCACPRGHDSPVHRCACGAEWTNDPEVEEQRWS